MMLREGFPGIRTRMPLVSAASHMWYWQMKSCSRKDKDVFNAADDFAIKFLAKNGFRFKIISNNYMQTIPLARFFQTMQKMSYTRNGHNRECS